MKRWSSAQVLRTAEFAYAIVVLFALTQGPVYRLWSNSALEIDRLPNPSMPHAYLATFIALQLPAMALWIRRLNHGWLQDRGNQALVVFIVWMAASVAWSTYARQSLPEVVSLVMTTSFGLYLAASFSARQFWAVIASAMAAGVGLSWLAVMRLWEGAVNFQEDYWVGIYYNRNSLAPVTAVAVIASVGAVISTWGIVRTSRRLLAAFSLIGGLTLSTFAGIELWQSKSQTSPIALAIALGAVTLWMVIRLLTRRARLFSSARPYSASIAFLLTGIVLFFALQFVGDVGGVSSEIVTLNSRRNLWSLSWMGVQEKPWFGWGWMAAWWTEEFFGESSSWSTWGSRWSHNGYHDVLLGGGWIAGSLLLAYLWFVTRSLSQYTFQDVAPRLTLAGFALAASTQESFFTGSHFIWALLIAALAPGRAFSRSISG